MSDLHADFVLKTDTSEIIHVEFQQSMTRDTLNRFFVYNALLTRQFDKPAITYVIYLGRAKIGEQKIENECVFFKPKMIKVYEIDAKSVLEKVKNGKGNYIEMALMPLMKNSKKGKLENLREMVSRQLLSKFKEKYTKDLKEKVRNGDMETLEYIVVHIFDITLDEVKKLL